VNYSDAIAFLYDLRWFGAKLGLSNTLKLAALAGDPHHKLRFIHVAGTNGKGSTCAMLESIYRAAGLRVGLFTSPHLVRFNERLQVNRHPIPEHDLIRLVSEMRSFLLQGWAASPALDETQATNSLIHQSTNPSIHQSVNPPIPQSNPAHPTFFEVVTVLALRYFAEQQCELVVWETGLGGRLDATNIVTPSASIITNIQFDHQEWLGHTLTSIAAEKGGIIKPGVPVITGTEAPEALEVIRTIAREKNAPLRVVSKAEAQAPPLDTLRLPLLGQHQKRNAAVALAAVRTLASRIAVSEQNIRAGLTRLDWPGRLQVISRASGQQILLDGAHNPGGAHALAAAIREVSPGAEPTLILGMLGDKDWAAMCEILAPLARRILLVPVQSQRSAAPLELAAVCRRANPAAHILEFDSLSAAFSATADDPLVVVAGSLYLVGEALELLRLSPGSGSRERDLNEWTARR
jgi:dihydrofolate synthase/folylpolyglutamate synthase